MTLIYGMGYDPTLETWQILYLVLLSWAAVIAAGGLVVDAYYREQHTCAWTILIFLAAFFSFHPVAVITWVLLFQYFLLTGAPLGAATVVLGISLLSACGFFHLTFPFIRNQNF